MEERLFKTFIHDVLEEVLLITLSMAHLTEDLAVTADDSLDRIVRTVRVIWRLHGHLFLKRIHILERNLTICKELTSPWLTAMV